MSKFIVLLLAFTIASSPAQDLVPLLSPENPASGWKFNNGQEFKGATGDLGVDPSALREGKPSLRLRGDFTKGGKYVEAGSKIPNIDIKELTMWVRNPGADRFTLRLIDASGQVHQVAMLTNATEDWQQLVFPLERFFARRGESDAVQGITKYESWGGRKDGKWHGPATAIYILLAEVPSSKTRALWLNDVAILSKDAPITAFKSDFEKPLDWITEGKVAIDTGSLLFTRTENEASQPTSASSPSFKVTPGNWRIELSAQADLKSPDSSYSGTVHLEFSDATGRVLGKSVVADVFGKKPAADLAQTILLPTAAATARFVARLNKTWGSFRIDDLTATFLPGAVAESPVSRILFSTARLGNLLFPEDPRTVGITVETNKELAADAREITCIVRDYWGAEQTLPMTVKPGSPERKGPRFIYQASVDLAGAALEVGKYYEVQASIGTFSHQTSLAILPEAVTRKYKPDEVPFTARNWDNRIPEYIRLADRLGVRICGIWGGWSSKPPYKPEAPRLELVKELGMGWLTTTPAKFIEDGKRDYDETALRQGVRNFIAEFGGHRPLIINLGNEPHGTGDRVKANVEAYRVLYDEIKKTDPTIPVVATSVEPNEEYFKLGYGKYCDAFDFHVYETPAGVRKNIADYQALQKKYDVVKPIWSTELGLNSQGQTRHVVAVDVIKKSASFFAAGGVNMSWFGFLYPDPEGKDYGSSGDSHNMFDCRFNRYAPRLDAIAYYNVVNAIGIKKFVEEKTYNDGIQAFLFRDHENRTLQILWKSRGHEDVRLPLAGVDSVQVIRIDGTRHELDAGKKDLTLTVDEDPVLLLYKGEGPLAAAFEKPSALWENPTATLDRSKPSRLSIARPGGLDLELLAPPRWQVSKSGKAGDPAGFELTPPAATTLREAAITVKITEDGRSAGQLHRRFVMKN